MRLKQISVSLECILDEFTQFFFKLEKLSYLPMTQSINGIKIQSNKWCKLHLKNRNEPTSSVFYLLWFKNVQNIATKPSVIPLSCCLMMSHRWISYCISPFETVYSKERAMLLFDPFVAQFNSPAVLLKPLFYEALFLLLMRQLLLCLHCRSLSDWMLTETFPSNRFIY